MVAGAVLIVMALTGLARTMRYIPVTVIEGFTIGIALLIGLQQVPYALGEQTHGDHSSVVATALNALDLWLAEPIFPALFLAFASAVTILLIGRRKPTFPTALVAVVMATLTTVLLGWEVPVVGQMPAGLVWAGIPDFTSLPLFALLIAALSVAGLAALESLLSATVADNMAKMPHHKPNREVFGQGIANLVAPLFGGVPATAAIARTAVNVRSGARTRLAAITHSAALLIFMLIGSKYVALIPLSSLAGVLIATSIRMVDVAKIKEFSQAAKTDFGVVALTAACTLLLDLMQAVLIGIVVAGALNFLQGRQNQVRHEAQVEEIEHLLEEYDN
jgi:SulP family sulfate permease